MAGNTKHVHNVALSRLPGNRSSRFVPYLIPGILGLAIIVIIPFVWNIYLSFTRWRGVGPVRFIGLQNWQRLFKDSTFWISFLNSFWIIVAIVVIPTILGCSSRRCSPTSSRRSSAARPRPSYAPCSTCRSCCPSPLPQSSWAGSSAPKTAPSTHSWNRSVSDR